MQLKSMAFCALAIGIFGTAQAQSSSTVNFTLTAPIALSTGIASIDAGRDTVGTWITDHRPNQSYWDYTYGMPTSIFLAGGIGQMGDPYFHDPRIFLPKGDGLSAEFQNGEAASYKVDRARVSESVWMNDKTIEARALAQDSIAPLKAYAESHWTRAFELNPHSSFTVSGLLSFNGVGTDPSAFIDGQYVNDFNLDGSIARGGRVEYHSDNSGLVSATFFNPGDTPLLGRLNVEIAAGVSAVPEPSVYLSMLVGLGIVGGIAGKRQKKGAVSTV